MDIVQNRAETKTGRKILLPEGQISFLFFM